MNNFDPQISVVMSVYNGEKYIRDAIDSILYQSFTNFEFIIVNDRSTDRSLEIIESYNDERIVLLNQNNSGLAKSLNNGINVSKSKFIARIDSDDISMPNRLKKQYYFLMNNPDYIIVGSNANFIDMNRKYVYTSSLKLTNNEIKQVLPQTPFFHPSVMYRKSAYYKAGKYPEYMLRAQDLVLFNRMAKLGKMANLEEPLIEYRVVPTANSNRDRIISNRLNIIIKRSIEKDHITDADSAFLKSLLKYRNSDKNHANYHIYLAKKYLWNNYQPKLARCNLVSALKYKKMPPILYLLYVLSFLPRVAVRGIYQSLKKL